MHFDQKHYKLAEGLSNMENSGESLKKVLMDAGYSENTANRGWSSVSNRAIKLLSRKGLRLKALGEIDAETQEKIVRGRLVYNTIKGSDKGILSAKALGSDRRINMFVAESQAGIVVISVPNQVMEQKAKLLADDPEE